MLQTFTPKVSSDITSIITFVYLSYILLLWTINNKFNYKKQIVTLVLIFQQKPDSYYRLYKYI